MSIPVTDMCPNAMVSISGAFSPVHIAKQLASAAKRDPDCFENSTGQHPGTEVSTLHNDPQRGGVLSHEEQQGAAWKACRKAAKRERHSEIRLANHHCESRVKSIEQESGRLDNARTTSRWLIGLKTLEITETEWTGVRNHLRSTGPEFFKRVKKDDAVVRCDSLKYTAQRFQLAALAFLLVAVRNGMPEQRLIDTVHMLRTADQMRVSEATIARDGALVHSAASVKNEGDVKHAPCAGGRRSNRPGNHKERRFRRSKRLKAQAQTDAKRQQWQPGWHFRTCVPDDRPSHGAHPPKTENVRPAHPTGKCPRLQKSLPREQRSAPFTNRSDFYRYRGRTEAQIWQADNPEEAERLLSVMRSISEKRPARSELQSTYELQWRIKNVWQPRSVFRHLVRTIWAEHDCQGQTPRHSDEDAQRWDRWIRFCTETHAVSTPAELPALKDFFYQHRTMTRAESILILKAMAFKHSKLGLKFPCALERLHEWMTADRAASLVHPGPVWSGQIFIQRDPSVSKCRGLVTGTLVTHDVVSTDSVDSIVSCFDGAGRLLGPSSTRRAYVQHEGHLSLAAAGMTVGDTCSILLRLRGGAGDKETAPSPAADTSPAAIRSSLQYPPPPQDGRADGGSSSTPNRLDAEGAEDQMRAGSDTAGAQAADGDTSRTVYAQGSIGVHVENPLYWLALPLNRSGSAAPASDLDKAWTVFFKGLHVADLTAACKARSLHVVAASGSVKRADFVTALQAWIHSHSVVISSFQDAQLLGLEASTN